MDHDRVIAVADLLIPASDGMPAASEVALAERWLVRVLEADPSLEAPVAALAECATWADLEALHDEQPDVFERGVAALLAAYYLHPGVRKRMGYPGQGASPILADEPEFYLRDGIIDPVRARGPIYVPTPHE